MIEVIDESVEILDKDIWGGKAANLSRMMAEKLPVPPAIVLSTDECFKLDFKKEKHLTSSVFATEVLGAIRYLVAKNSKTWGGSNPMVVSVRSGAPISMPGMMETILNVGLTRDNLETFAESRNASLSSVYDSYRRLIQMYAITVDGVDSKVFSEVYNAFKVFYNGEFTEEVNQRMVEMFEEIYQAETGKPFTDDINEQLIESCNAVFKSWHSEKAVKYRELEGISHKMGTAVIIQEMVFGNLGPTSATGVVFSHNPNTGELGWYGDYLPCAQGEDVVAGTHIVQHIEDIMYDENLASAGKDLLSVISRLYKTNRDILDIEFTIENGKLWVLQYRKAKCSTRASIRSIVDLTRTGSISTDEAMDRVLEFLPKQSAGSKDPGDLKFLGTGIPATDGEVIGKIAVGHKAAQEYKDAGEPYIYVAHETAPEDVSYMKDAVGVLTASGGLVSHAALIARAWDKTCVLGFSEIKVVEDGFKHHDILYPNGVLLKINGKTGDVYA